MIFTDPYIKNIIASVLLIKMIFWILLIRIAFVCCAKYTKVYTDDNTIYRLFAVTYASEIEGRPEFCMAAVSAVAYGFSDLNVIGLDRQAQFAKWRLLDKVFGLRDFVMSLPKIDQERNLILFFDAYDVLVNSSPLDLVHRFLKSGQKIMFASEKGCSGTKWHVMNRRNTCDDEWPIPTRQHVSPWINSGVFMGFQQEMRLLLQEAYIEHKNTLPMVQPGQIDPYVGAGDQLLFGHLFAHVDRVREDLQMGIDVNSDIWKCMYQVQYMDTTDLLIHQGKVSFKGSVYIYPVLIHFNGPPHMKKEMILHFAKLVQLPSMSEEQWDTVVADTTLAALCRFPDANSYV